MKQPIQPIVYTCLLLLALCSLPGLGFASNEPYAARPLTGNQVHKDSSSLVIDTVYFNPSLKPTQTTYSVQNLITFKINEFANVKLPDLFTVTVKFKVYFTRDFGGSAVADSSALIELQIGYNKNSTYAAKAIHAFKGGHRAEVKIFDVVVNSGSLPDFESVLMLENELSVSREYAFDCTNNAVQAMNAPSFNANNGELTVSWGSQRAADEYDLEWTYIDSLALANYVSSSTYSANLIFPNNATRVSIATTSYRIPLLYDGGGHLFYRVRAVQVKANGQRIESQWSTDFSAVGYYAFSGHENKLNWQATTSFAEDGKRKSVVQYFDGSLRNRQTVTKDNTTDTTLVAETFYDHQGRPAVQVLPSPSLSSLIKFNPNYNSALNGAEYDKVRYDGNLADSCYCKEGAEAFSTDSGTARYYSPNNPLKNTGFHQYIPDANGFVFSETRYTPDNTDRVSLQSGVGAEFSIDSGRATRYYYSAADQEELDALFGTDAGNASHYFKNMVRDANGQYSVSYVDMHGRTIATALAGTPAVKLDKLASNQPLTITKKLLDSTTNIIKGTTIESSRGLVVTRAGDHRFRYSLLPDSISIQACDAANICYDCSYNLEITITDDCNNSSLPGGVPYVITANNLTIDTACNPLVAFPGVDNTVYLKEGNYLVTKKLTVSPQAMDAYRAVFLRRNTCKTLEQFIAEQKAQLDLACEPTCVDCTTEPMDQSMRAQMLADVSAPYGQYADLNNAEEFYSIFAEDPEGAGYYYAGVGPFKDADGADEALDPRTFSREEFAASFKPSWAANLLPLHPEYPKLQKYEALHDSHVWDLAFEKVETFQEAVDKGYLNPGNFSGLPATAIYSYNTLHADPLFTTLAPEMKDMMQDSLQYRAKDNDNNWVGAWALATIMAHCPDGDDNCRQNFSHINTAFTMDTACSGELDIAWRYFREMYLQEKQKVVDSLLTLAAISADKDPSYYDMLDDAHTLNFPNRRSAEANPDLALTENEGQAGIDGFIADNCAAYAQQWWQELKPCSFNNADSATIINRLIQVCREGGDAEHVFGASTVKPSSTNTDRSFEQVIKAYAGSGYNSTCHVYLLSAPPAYENRPMYYDKPLWQKPDSCECSTISTLYDAYQMAGSDTSFSDYLFRRTGTRIYPGVLDTLRKACSGEIDCSFLKEPLSLPPVLQCDGGQDVCVPCKTVDTLYQRFKLEFPGVVPTYAEEDTTQRKKNTLFETFMNRHLGFAKQTGEYLSFLDSCHAGNTACDSLLTIHSAFHYFTAVDSSHFVKFRITPVDEYGVSDMYNGGVAHIPDNYINTIEWGSRYTKRDTLCVNNVFTVETRIKRPGKDLNSTTVDFHVFFNQDGQYQKVAPVFIQPGTAANATDSANILANSGKLGYGAAGDYTAPLRHFVPDFSDYRVIKIKHTADNYWRVYYDDSLVSERFFDTTVRRLLGFSVGFEGVANNGYVDYFKVYDENGVLQYVEDFEDAVQSLSNTPAAYKCPGSGCELTFTNYFNQQKGTSYTFAQIQALYTACGIPFNPCGDTVLPKLAVIRKDFLNNYYNHGRKYDSNGCDISTWGVNYGGSILNTTTVPHNQIFKNGVMQFPDTLNVPPRNWNVDYDFVRKDSACVDRHFSLEIRTKQPLYEWQAFNKLIIEMWFGFSPNKKYYLVMDKKNPASSLIAYYDFGTAANSRQYNNVTEFGQDYSTYRVIKLEMIDSVLHFYLDNQLIRSFNFPAGIGLEKWYGFGMSSISDRDLSASFDWIKAYDKNGKLFYFDDFNSCSDHPLFAPYMHCDLQPCTTAFTNYYNQQSNTHYNFNQLDSLYHAHGLQLEVCERADPGLTLCGRNEPVFPAVAIQRHTPCDDSTLFAVSKGTLLYEAYRDSLINHFDERYLAKCLNARYNEQFTVEQPVSEFHYTLYYYDQAGNLVKTIPPAGVDVSKFAWSANWRDSVASARRNNTVLTPKHKLRTTYQYNTLNQVVAQESPDGGHTDFWFDRLGRMAISRNAKQKASAATEEDRLYSYTSYDVLGRITEVGQVKNLSSNGGMTEQTSRSETALNDWLLALSGRKEQITNTVYDLPYTGFDGLADKRLVVAQRNLRNRVSYVSYTNGSNPSAYNQASFYTYDILGNVDTLLQDYGCNSCGSPAVYNMMNRNGNRWKKLSYQYDLISGKVNMVMYQRGWNDQWLHRYTYDAENRLTLVETSTDSLLWEKDARYDYYRHGPLARTTIGEQLVQGIDYAYTLQGWLKGINSTGGTETHDIGGDGRNGHLNQFVARDAVGLNLNYFSGDYKPININVTPFPSYRSATSGMGLHDSAYRPLYNGNISSMAYYNKLLENGGAGILYSYKYDQLNRLLQQDAYAGFNRSGNHYNEYLNTYGNTFREELTYDANGNILTDNKNALSTDMDRLTYHYYPNSNKLKYVFDAVDANKYGSGGAIILDVDAQPDSNYVYDEIGNLIKDSAEKISSIQWNVYGKITEINRTPTTQVPYSKILFTYDAQGNRIGKTAINSGPDSRTEYSWYVRDAQGNVIATYGGRMAGTDIPATSLQDVNPGLAERHIYGSSRLGINSKSENVPDGPVEIFGYSGTQYTRGYRNYELTNHLGNVLSTISDKKFGVSSGGVGAAIDYYTADITGANDYYPFGMLSRMSLGNYRYGFNGKENDFEAKGWQNQQDYGMRIYDPRIGRFLSVDPITKDYPELTPYQFASNTPIWAIDIDGLEAGIPNSAYTPSGIPLADRWLTSEGRKTYFKGLGIGTVVGAAIVTDIFVTKGALTRTAGTVFTIWGASEVYEHTNRNSNQRNPDLRAENEKNAKGAVVDLIAGRVTEKSISVLTKIIAEGGVAIYKYFSPTSIRFSQSSVNGLNEIVKSMEKQGWKGDPIDIVKMEDGIYTAVDNTRLLAAEKAMINVKANAHAFDEVIPKEMAIRFADKQGNLPSTWGEAVKNRLANQNKTFRTASPNGSFIQPTVKE